MAVLIIGLGFLECIFLCSLARSEPHFMSWDCLVVWIKMQQAVKWGISCHSKLLSTWRCWHEYECYRMPLAILLAQRALWIRLASKVMFCFRFPSFLCARAADMVALGPSWMNVRLQRVGKSSQLLWVGSPSRGQCPALELSGSRQVQRLCGSMLCNPLFCACCRQGGLTVAPVLCTVMAFLTSNPSGWCKAVSKRTTNWPPDPWAWIQ